MIQAGNPTKPSIKTPLLESSQVTISHCKISEIIKQRVTIQRKKKGRVSNP